MNRQRFLYEQLPVYAPDDGAGADAADDAAGTGADNGAAGADAGTAADTGAAGTDGAAAAVADPVAAAAQQADWRDREIRRKHAQLQDERRRNQELSNSLESANAMLQRLGGGDAAAAPAVGAAARGADPAAARPAPRAAPVDNDAAVQRRAEQIVAQHTFEKASNDADAAGRGRYGADWQKATGTLETLGGFDIDTMNNILASDDPAKVLFELGNKPEEYQRVMDLPPAKRFAEIIKLGMPAPKTARKPSGAPAPVDPVGGRNRGDPTALTDELDDDTWYARRAAQKKTRYEQRRAGHA